MQPGRSVWADTAPIPTTADRSPLHERHDADVAIVGAGFSGLWTAYYLAAADPHLRVAVLEAHEVGYGASGRNGGWCSALLPMGLDAIAAASSTSEASRFQRAMIDTVDEVGRVAVNEHIECGFVRSGTITVARTASQMARLVDDIAAYRRFGFGDDQIRLLTLDEVSARLGASRVLGASFTDACATIHPLRLVHGLATAVERRGVRIFEHSPVRSIEAGLVRCDTGSVVAPVIVRTTEAFTHTLPGLRRAVAPIHSLMVATAPIPADRWEHIGLQQRETFCDARRLVIYGQRTSDDRIAFGGRGAPYHFGSRIGPRYDTNPATHRAIADTLRELLPALGDVEITHEWGGAVAAARDWWCSVHFDPRSGTGSAGGYVGDGVATTNLAGRTLADLIMGRHTDLTSLPWVHHRSRQWEPEPFRWLGINGMVRVTAGLDAREARTDRPARLRSALLDRLTGH